ncbi:MAG: hypothetical protein FD156_195 [Nitrospirae bacterium]|nr:MAG: hypothetical protein FD156_195 [Nitrospirota bacterium]
MDLKELLDAYKTAKVELDAVIQKPKLLHEKIEAANRQLNYLENAISEVAREKERTLIGFASGNLTEADLKAVRDSLKKLNNEKAEIEELLDASDKASRQIQKETMALSSRVTNCRRVFWSAVLAELKNEKITGDMVSAVYEIYAAASLSGEVEMYGSFLHLLFPLPSIAEVKKVQGELVEKYGVK